MRLELDALLLLFRRRRLRHSQLDVLGIDIRQELCHFRHLFIIYLSIAFFYRLSVTDTGVELAVGQTLAVAGPLLLRREAFVTDARQRLVHESLDRQLVPVLHVWCRWLDTFQTGLH